MSASEVRIILIILAVIVLGLIYWFGRPQGQAGVRKRKPRAGRRVEPILDDLADEPDEPLADGWPEAEDGVPVQAELDVGPRPEPARAVEAATPVRSAVGRRPASAAAQHIVSLLVVAREGQPFHGADIVVAAEKTGLQYGDLGIFHRLDNGSSEHGPVFSVANMLEPGGFDMATIRELRTPGLNVFMVLPGPLAGLDAWEAMLPTARRLAELLDGQVVDDQSNALGRQRVAYLRDELRDWDRKHEIDQGRGGD